MRAIVVDDDPSAAGVIAQALRKTGQVDVVGTVYDGTACLEMVAQTHPDVVFLDIEMPGVSGLDVAEALLGTDDSPFVVFVTGHNEYAVQAFDLEALDYIVKPLEPVKLERRVRRAVERLSRLLESRSDVVRELREKITSLSGRVDELSDGPGALARRRLPVKDYQQGTVRLIDPQQITYVVRQGDRVIVVTDERQYPTYYTVDQMESRLSSQGFLRINPGTLVNMGRVDHLIPNGDGSYDLVLADEKATVLTASRRRSRALMEFVKPE